MEIEKISLQQNLRDDLIFDLFAPQKTKDILLYTKNEDLRRMFKRLWVRYLAENIRGVKATEEEIEKGAAALAAKCVALDILCVGLREFDFRKKAREFFLKPLEISLEDGDFS